MLGYAGGGCIAWVNGFCAITAHKMGYCGINSSFNTVPTYSWTVKVVAHEEGHLFGSNHTHSCVWNGNNTKIDACGDEAGYPSGPCPWTVPSSPPGGGTIMSYCHLTSVGVNFNLGFGPQPAALMLNNEETSSCLSACSGCTPPSQPGTITGGTTVCQSASQTY
ncbi:MAG: M12 family metallo-peptidase, partial [Bacteroidota bacterium]